MKKNQHYQQFYRQCYTHTGGWLPMWPLTESIKIGDFCQMTHGIFRPLGNIGQLVTLEDILLSHPMLLAQQEWCFSWGVEHIVQQSVDWAEQLFSFAEAGKGLFYLNKPTAQFILNWSEFQESLVIKMTQTEYAFRDIYVITAVTSGADWGGAIARSPDAEVKLTVPSNVNQFEHHSLLKHASVQAEVIKHVDYFKQPKEQPCYFFKAKKLVLSDKKKEQVQQELFKQNREENSSYWRNWQQTNLLERIPRQEITTVNCLDYFEWRDLTLEEVESLCHQ